MGTLEWKEILPGVTTNYAIPFITSDKMHLLPATHRWNTTQGMATIEGMALAEQDQQPQVRPTQAIWVTATRAADITITAHSACAAIKYALDPAGSTDNYGWPVRWATVAERLSHTALNDTLTLQIMGPARRPTQKQFYSTKHTVWYDSTTLHRKTVA